MYHWCVVPGCSNTNVKNPDKLWIKMPNDINRRKTWLKLARRDPKSLSPKTRLFFCEDHFDLENDMDNYIQYKIMGSVKRIRMKPNCIPSRFNCQMDRKRKARSGYIKRKRVTNKIKENVEDKDYNKISTSVCNQDFEGCLMECNSDQAVQPVTCQINNTPESASSKDGLSACKLPKRPQELVTVKEEIFIDEETISKSAETVVKKEYLIPLVHEIEVVKEEPFEPAPQACECCDEIDNLIFMKEKLGIECGTNANVSYAEAFSLCFNITISTEKSKAVNYLFKILKNCFKK